jgi:predicted Rdx family selenoprotein
VPGAKSQFDVLADDRLVFSKQQKGRFPDADELLAAVG